MPYHTRATPLLPAALMSMLIVACAPAHSARSSQAPNVLPSTQSRPSVARVSGVSDAQIRYPGAVRTRSSARSSMTARSRPAAMAGGVLGEVNRERRRTGARPLVADARLNRAAERYARELASRREIEHVSATPGLRTFRDRMHAAGARARIAGENLARLTSTSQSLPSRTVRAWLRSPGHRANLLDPAWQRSGVGVWLGRDGVWYIVQLYATAD